MPDRIFNTVMRSAKTPMDLSPVNVISGSTTLDGGHGTVIVDSTAGDITITLPQAAGHPGQYYVVHKKVAANTVTVVPTSPDTIGYGGQGSTLLSTIDAEASFLSGGSENVWLACGCSGTFPGTLSGVLFARSGTASTFAISTSAQYSPIGVASSPMAGNGTIGDVQLRLPRAVTFTAMYVQLLMAMVDDDILTCQVNVNGTADSAISVVHDSTTGTELGDTGSIVAAAGDLICLEWSFSGFSSASVASVSLAYEVLPE